MLMPTHSVKLLNITSRPPSSGCNGGPNEYLLVNPYGGFFALFLSSLRIVWSHKYRAHRLALLSIDLDTNTLEQRVTRVAVQWTIVPSLVEQQYLFID
jgi:hypothetical protein